MKDAVKTNAAGGTVWVTDMENDPVLKACQRNMEEHYAKLSTPRWIVPSGVAKPPSAEESDAMVKFQQQVDKCMDNMYKSPYYIGYNLAAPPPYRLTVDPPPPAPAIIKCSGCDQERDLGATGKCWDCYVSEEENISSCQEVYDKHQTTIKRTLMQSATLDPLWQRNPNVGVWRLR